MSTQVYEYVPDMPKAMAELARILRPGGRAVVLDTAWDSWVCATDDREQTLWFHLVCAAYKRPATLLETLEERDAAVGRGIRARGSGGLRIGRGSARGSAARAGHRRREGDRCEGHRREE